MKFGKSKMRTQNGLPYSHSCRFLSHHGLRRLKVESIFSVLISVLLGRQNRSRTTNVFEATRPTSRSEPTKRTLTSLVPRIESTPINWKFDGLTSATSARALMHAGSI